jgi:hypothetical protein
VRLRDMLRFYQRPPDERPVTDVEADIRAELDFHIAERERELIESGVEAGVAAETARRRFGSVDRVFAACREIELGERIMLQRINFALTIAALVLLGVFLWRAEIGRSQTAEGFRAMQGELAELRTFVATTAAERVAAEDDVEPRAREDDAATRAPSSLAKFAGLSPQERALLESRFSSTVPRGNGTAPAEGGPYVYALGKLAAPGRYPIVEGRTGFTLSKCVALAGDFEEFAARKKVTILRQTATGRVRIFVDFDEIIEGKRPDFPLQPDDVVYVSETFF